MNGALRTRGPVLRGANTEKKSIENVYRPMTFQF